MFIHSADASCSFMNVLYRQITDGFFKMLSVTDLIRIQTPDKVQIGSVRNSNEQPAINSYLTSDVQ